MFQSAKWKAQREKEAEKKTPWWILLNQSCSFHWCGNIDWVQQALTGHAIYSSAWWHRAAETMQCPPGTSLSTRCLSQEVTTSAQVGLSQNAQCNIQTGTHFNTVSPSVCKNYNFHKMRCNIQTEHISTQLLLLCARIITVTKWTVYHSNGTHFNTVSPSVFKKYKTDFNTVNFSFCVHDDNTILGLFL